MSTSGSGETVPGSGTVPRTGDDPLVSRFDAILSDLDGVVYAGPDAVPGAVESLNRAQQDGITVAYVTNNASRSVGAVAEHLNGLGLHTDETHMVSSAQSAAALAASMLPAGAPVQICGAEALADCARAEGLSVVPAGHGAQGVLQGFDPELGWQDLAEAAYLLADPEVLWVASNTDLTIPKERGIAPGNGTLVAAVATATRRRPHIAGKPGAAIFRTVVDRLGVKSPVVIGDRLDTDVLGATNAGIPSIAVMTGVQTHADVLNARTAERPDHVLDSLTELFLAYSEPEVVVGEATATANLDEVVAQADQQTVGISGPEGTQESATAWRAARAAWWAVHPEEDEPTDARIVWG